MSKMSKKCGAPSRRRKEALAPLLTPPHFFDFFDVRPLRGGAGRGSTRRCAPQCRVESHRMLRGVSPSQAQPGSEFETLAAGSAMPSFPVESAARDPVDVHRLLYLFYHKCQPQQLCCHFGPARLPPGSAEASAEASGPRREPGRGRLARKKTLKGAPGRPGYSPPRPWDAQPACTRQPGGAFSTPLATRQSPPPHLLLAPLLDPLGPLKNIIWGHVIFLRAAHPPRG